MRWRIAPDYGQFVLTSLGVSLLFVSAAGQPCSAADKEDIRGRVAEAIDSIRGTDLSKLSDAEKDAVGKRLDEAWKVILDNPKESKPTVRAALTQEHEDSFRIIDLAHLLLALDSDLLAEAAAALTRADPNAYPDGYFKVASGMAAAHCESCLPAVLKMLELRQLNTGIPEHALPVDLELGLIFTIGQYGDAALDGVRPGLESENCVIRGNAALVVGQLLPVVEPAAVREIARGDSCEESRLKAWEALGALDSPSLAALAAKRLASEKPPSIEERKAMVSGLSLAFSRAVIEPLIALSGDSDQEISNAAKKGREDIEKYAPTPAELRTKAGSASPASRSKVQRLLKKAKQDGRFEFEGKRMELLAALVSNDLTLLNQARAAVLNRVSDECLYEYFDMTYVARALRSMKGTENTNSRIDTTPDPAPRREDR